VKLNSKIVERSSARIERSYGALKAAPAPQPKVTAARIERVTNYVNATAASTDFSALERAVGTNDLLGLNYFWLGLQAARAVARIVIPAVPGERVQVATGFLISPNLLLTNWHVLETDAQAARASVQFGYEAGIDGRELPSTWFKVRPDLFVLRNEQLDYCVVAVDNAVAEGPESLSSFGWLRLNPRLGKTDYGQYLSIIQHPGGQLKQIAIRENRLLPFTDADDFLSYQSDTFRGSSGSPVFNDFWDVVALHHSGKPERDAIGNYIDHDGNPIVGREPEEHEIRWVANEGARVSRIVEDIRARAAGGELKDGLLATFDGELLPSVKAPSGASPESGEQPLRAVVPAAEPAWKAEDSRALFVVPLGVSVRIERAERADLLQKTTAAAPTTPTTAGTKSVLLFEKLNFDADYAGRGGYDEAFLGRERMVPIPTIDPTEKENIAPTRTRGKVLHYHHFSIIMHAKRRMPMLSAGNVDYRAASRDERDRDAFGKDQWILDERMDSRFQIPKRFYDRWRRLDFGHLVRRDDNCWGASADEIEYSNADTFHMTNCTPQHEAFNRDMFQFNGLWGQLENLVSKQATADAKLSRLSIFSGPIFTARKDLKIEDEDYGAVYIPLAFWKVIVAPLRRGGIGAYGFIVRQAQELDDDPPFVEDFSPGDLEEYQVSLENIESQTAIRFGNALKAADVMSNHPNHEESLLLESAEDLWLGSSKVSPV
jgi:endonuclease G, mitochondrial